MTEGEKLGSGVWAVPKVCSVAPVPGKLGRGGVLWTRPSVPRVLPQGLHPLGKKGQGSSETFPVSTL